MLRDIWANAPTTAAMYVGIILLLYAIGMFLLLIQSIVCYNAKTRYELLLGFSESVENKALFSEMTGLY